MKTYRQRDRFSATLNHVQEPTQRRAPAFRDPWEAMKTINALAVDAFVVGTFYTGAAPKKPDKAERKRSKRAKLKELRRVQDVYGTEVW